MFLQVEHIGDFFAILGRLLLLLGRGVKNLMLDGGLPHVFITLMSMLAFIVTIFHFTEKKQFALRIITKATSTFCVHRTLHMNAVPKTFNGLAECFMVCSK